MDISQIDDYKETEVLIIGAGAAGIRTAIELHQNGVESLLLSKREFGDAHTKMAAGGINASLGSLDPEDSWEIHAADTLREGHFINDPHAVELVCQNAPEAVKELQNWGCPFSTTEDGKIEQRFFGAQSFRRTCYVGDKTGKAILDTLVDKAKELGIPCHDGVNVFHIVKEGQKVVGALAIDKKSSKIVLYKAKFIVLAAAGYASIYSRSSSRRDENLGDTIQLALQAGAKVKDMEMVQFHPTGMVKPEDYEGQLVTEAVRGEGGHLINNKGERFMKEYSPEMKELDARDEVARAIAKEISKGNGTEDDGVYLDISHKDAVFIKEKLPQMYDRFKELGIDLAESAMEVAPTAHYAMGGVAVDFSNGYTGVPGFYAVGEATCGLHGANRLGGNSLMETVVLGRLTGKAIAEEVKNRDIFLPELDCNAILEKCLNFAWQKDPLKVIRNIKSLMWEKAGILRKEDTLQEGIEALEKIKSGLEQEAEIDELSQEQVWQNLDLQNVLRVAELVLKAAQERKESRGAHYRDDYPDTDENWRKNILWSLTDDGLQMETQGVGEVSEKVQKALDENHSLDYHQLE